jgi:hypothetical protein
MGRRRSGEMPRVVVVKPRNHARVRIGGRAYWLGKCPDGKVTRAQHAEAARLWHRYLAGRQPERQCLRHLRRALPLRRVDPVPAPWLVDARDVEGPDRVRRVARAQLDNERACAIASSRSYRSVGCRASGSRSSTATCRAVFRVWNTSCDTAPGCPLRWSGSPSGVVRTAASPTSAMCCPVTRRPTGSARPLLRGPS